MLPPFFKALYRGSIRIASFLSGIQQKRSGFYQKRGFGYRGSSRKYRVSNRNTIVFLANPRETIVVPPDKYRGSIRQVSGIHTGSIGVPPETMSGIQQAKYRGSSR